MLTVVVVFTVAAAIACIVHTMGRCPLWVAVMCLCVAGLVQALPIK
jgi:hypothetical protein